MNDGDRGTTLGPNGKSRAKYSSPINFLGNLDELNAHLSLLVEKYVNGSQRMLRAPQPPQLFEQLSRIQHHIFQICASVRDMKERVGKDDVTWLESVTDEMSVGNLPKGSFVFPYPADIHLTRAICRRAERSFFDFVGAGDMTLLPMGAAGPFLNRLGDYLMAFSALNLTENAWIDQFWVEQ